MYVHKQLEKLPFQIGGTKMSKQLHLLKWIVNGLQTAKERMGK